MMFTDLHWFPVISSNFNGFPSIRIDLLRNAFHSSKTWELKSINPPELDETWSATLPEESHILMLIEVAHLNTEMIRAVSKWSGAEKTKVKPSACLKFCSWLERFGWRKSSGEISWRNLNGKSQTKTVRRRESVEHLAISSGKTRQAWIRSVMPPLNWVKQKVKVGGLFSSSSERYSAGTGRWLVGLSRWLVGE